MNHVGKIVSLIVYAVMAGLEFGSWRHIPTRENDLVSSCMRLGDRAQITGGAFVILSRETYGAYSIRALQDRMEAQGV